MRDHVFHDSANSFAVLCLCCSSENRHESTVFVPAVQGPGSPIANDLVWNGLSGMFREGRPTPTRLVQWVLQPRQSGVSTPVLFAALLAASLAAVAATLAARSKFTEREVKADAGIRLKSSSAKSTKQADCLVVTTS